MRCYPIHDSTTHGHALTRNLNGRLKYSLYRALVCKLLCSLFQRVESGYFVSAESLHHSP